MHTSMAGGGETPRHRDPTLKDAHTTNADTVYIANLQVLDLRTIRADDGAAMQQHERRVRKNE